MNDFGYFLIVLLIIIGIVFGLSAALSNANATANCRMLSENGHNTHLENYWFIFKNCYVGNVPYDRWIKVEGDLK